MITRKDWQDFKKKHKIEDGMAKVSIGPQLDKWHKSKGGIGDLNTLKAAMDAYTKAVSKEKYGAAVKRLFEENYDDTYDNLPLRMGQCFTRLKLANVGAIRAREKISSHIDGALDGDEAALRGVATQLNGLLKDYTAVYGHQKKSPTIQRMYLVAQRAFTANNIMADREALLAMWRNFNDAISELKEIEREYEAFVSSRGVI